MKRISTIILSACVLLIGLAPKAYGQLDFSQEKRAQTVFKFLNGPMNARASAMGGAMASIEGTSAALFFNPAGIAYQDGFADLALTRTQFITDINYNAATLSIRPSDGLYGVLGLSVVAVDYGNLQETVRADNQDGFIDLGTFSPSAVSIGLGYARALTDRFSVGGHVKYASLDLGGNVDRLDQGRPVRVGSEENVFAYDFGMMYHTGFRGLTFAVQARNFSPEVTFARESEELPLSLQMGVSMDVSRLVPAASAMHSMIVSVDAESPRDYSERVKMGAEYTFMDVLSLRAGYRFPADEQGVSLGAGIQQELGGLGVGIDYGYSDWGVFNGANHVHHLGFNLSF